MDSLNCERYSLVYDIHMKFYSVMASSFTAINVETVKSTIYF